MRIAFIGLGAMGTGMAANQVKKGREVVAFDLSKDALARAKANGCEIAASTPEAVKGADAVITMLPAGQQVREVYLGPDGVLAKAKDANIVFCQLVPWQFDHKKQMNLKRTFRRAAFLVSRLAANLGASASTPILSRFHSPVVLDKTEKRWLDGLYLDVPEEWDDPYRYFRW